MVSLRSLFFLAVFAPMSLQAQASPYVPIDDIAYKYVDALMVRGSLSMLSALERPYTASSIRSAVDTALSHEPSTAMRGFLRALEARLE